MDPMKQHDDSKPLDSVKGSEVVESTHSQLDSAPSEAQSTEEAVEPTYLHLDSTLLQAQSTVEVVGSDDLLTVSTPSEAQSTGGENLHNGDAEVVADYASNTLQNSYDHQNSPTNVRPLFYDSNNNFVYNGCTYYSYDALEGSHEYYVLLSRAMRMDLIGTTSIFDNNGPLFSSNMLFVTGGSPAVINPLNGLPWRKGANLCRPYMDKQCCPYGTACAFDHPWPLKK